MVLSYPTFAFFANLFVISLIALPIFHWTKSPTSRNVILGTTGAVLTFYISPRLLVFFLIYWLFAWILNNRLAKQIEAGKDPDSFVILSGVTLLLVPLLWWRLDAPLFLATLATKLNDLLRFIAPQLGAVDRSSTILPVGLSFGTFRAIDVMIKTYLGVEDRISRSSFFAYAFFPTVLIVGPIIERKEMANPRSTRQGSFTKDDYLIGFVQIIVGLVKIFVFSRPLEQFRGVIDDPASFSAIDIWVGLALFYVSFYLNFAGYSDLAIGFGRLFGCSLLPNFRSPLTKGSPQQFWNNWHMSLTRFAQRNVFVPLGGFRASSRRSATAVTMLVIALWHGVSSGLLFFAVWHTIGLLYWPSEPADPSRITRAIRVAGTFVFVLVSLPLLLLTTGQAFVVYKAMVGLGS